jgi:hypothetical protein
MSDKCEVCGEPANPRPWRVYSDYGDRVTAHDYAVCSEKCGNMLLLPLGDVRRAWQAWKDAWGTGDSEEALALMEMDLLLGVDDQGNVV